MYKLVAFDFDGTLVDSSLEVRPRVRAALRRAMDLGVHVTLATGRGFPAVAAAVADLGIGVPVVCHQGGQVIDPATAEVLLDVPLPRELAREALQLAEAQDLHLLLYYDDEMYVRELRHDRDFYGRWFGLPVHVVPDLAPLLARDPTKWLIVAEPDECDRLHAELKARFAGRCEIVRSHRLIVEGSALHVSKGSALAFIAKRLGVPREATIAVGDNDNDRAMIEWAGLGVAMGNAPAELRAIADYVAPPVQEDGAADVLERFVLRNALDQVRS